MPNCPSLAQHATVLLSLLAMVPAAGVASSSELSKTVLVGVAKVDITPEQPVRMYGYAARKTESEGIAGRLKAAALAVGNDEGDGPAVLLTVDCGAVPAKLRDDVLHRLQARITLQPERLSSAIPTIIPVPT